MKKNPEKDLPKELRAALKRFPKVVARRERLVRERKAFLKKTFGPIVRQLRRLK